MKKTILIFTTLILMTSSLIYGQDFRKTTWGMTKNQVKQTETSEIIKETNEAILYSVKLAGYESFVGYIFVDNKLTRAKYLIIEKHSNKNDYIVDYSSIKNLLEKKYGIPKEHEKIWKNDLYKDDYSQWGFAISLGHLMYYSIWETDKTDIIFSLYGDNYKLNTVIEYSSIELKEFEKKAREKKNLDNF